MTFNADVLARILEQAGRDILLPSFAAVSHASRKPDGSVVTATDLACQSFIAGELRKLAPEIAFLGEEMDEKEQLSCLRESGGRYWCLDPLDGTTNFVAGIPAFAASLALIENGEAKFACVHDPVRRETFTAEAGKGAKRNGEAMHANDIDLLADAVGYIDFKRLTAEKTALLVGRNLYRSQRNIGSCALEWAWLAAGRGHFIIHGGEKIWDFAAGSLLASEAGCMVGNFAGGELFPASSLTSPLLAASSAPVQAELRQLLASE